MLSPVTARDTDVAVLPETGDSAAATVVDPLKLDAVPYSNDTVVEAKLAFTAPVRVTVVVPTDEPAVPLTVGGATGITALDAIDTSPVPAAFVALTRNV